MSFDKESKSVEKKKVFVSFFFHSVFLVVVGGGEGRGVPTQNKRALVALVRSPEYHMNQAGPRSAIGRTPDS